MPKLKTTNGNRFGPAGFTLVELMAGIVIFGILMAIAIPPIYRSMDTQSSRQNADALGGRLRLARSQALSSYSDVIVYFGLDGAGTYTVHVDNGGGLGIPSDPNFDITNKNNGNVDSEEPVFTPVSIEERNVFGFVDGAETSYGDNLHAAISFDGDPPRVVFHSNGTATADGWVGILPLTDFLEQNRGRDFLVEVRAATGEINVVRATH